MWILLKCSQCEVRLFSCLFQRIRTDFPWICCQSSGRGKSRQFPSVFTKQKKCADSTSSAHLRHKVRALKNSQQLKSVPELKHLFDTYHTRTSFLFQAKKQERNLPGLCLFLLLSDETGWKKAAWTHKRICSWVSRSFHFSSLFFVPTRFAGVVNLICFSDGWLSHVCFWLVNHPLFLFLELNISLLIFYWGRHN